MSEQDWPSFLSVQQVAELLGVSNQTVLRTIARGELAAIRAGARQLRIEEGDLRDYLVRQRARASGGGA